MNDNNPESKSLIRDLKSQIRKEKLFSLAKTHLKTLIYCLSLVILIAVFLATFSFYNQVQSKKYSSILHQAMIDEQNGDQAKSEESLKNIYESSAPAGVKEIASLKYAAHLMKNGKSDQGIEVYLTINKNKKFDTYVREYSGLIALKALVDIDNQDDRDKILTLEAKLEKESKVLKYHIIEQKGIFLWNSGDFEVANAAFKTIAENLETSETLKKRAVEMVNIYKSKFGEEIAKAENRKEGESDNQAK